MQLRLLLAVALATGPVGCGDDDGGSGDAGSRPDARGSDAGPTPCTGDGECDDGLHCNGEERCTGGACAAGIAPECDDGDACTVDACDEASAGCTHEADDDDGDGHTDAACGGDDCDDEDDRVYPGATETCDARDLDEDCDPLTVGARDGDMDGAIDALCCNRVDGADPNCGTDCDDARPGVSPTATETCNDRDDDCDGMIDDGVLLPFYRDVDGDGFGLMDMIAEACGAPSGYAVVPGDCDDAAASIHPGAADGPPGACNGVDDDCSGAPDEGCECTEPASRPCGTALPGGGFLETGACRSGVASCIGGRWGTCTGAVAPEAESCTRPDDEDCDAETNEFCPCEEVHYGTRTLMFGLRGGDVTFNGLRFHFVRGDVDRGPGMPAYAEIEVRCAVDGHLIRHFTHDVGDFEYFLDGNASGLWEHVMRVDSGHPDGTTLYVQITCASSGCT